MPIQILDCTIRDGGHLNKWKFDSSVVKAAYFASLHSGVDYFEIGYRYPPETTGVGEFAKCTDEFLFKLIESPGNQCKLTVMIDAGKCRADYFPECIPERTPIKAVRVAAYPYEIATAISQLEELHGKGYEVFLNLMASSELTEASLQLLKSWPNKGCVSALCFADSFGGFLPDDIADVVGKLNPLGFRRLGFHAHNNLQLAFANALRAIDLGVEVIDASIFGMGRGAGNLPLEILVGFLEKNGQDSYNVFPYIDVIDRYFTAMKSAIGWGYSLPGLLSGLGNIHPYYVDNLFKSDVYTINEIWNALDTIKERCPISYSADRMKEAMGQRFYTPLTTEHAADVVRSIAQQIHISPAADSSPTAAPSFLGHHSQRNFLVIANGPSALHHRDRIQAFARKNQCVTIGLNNLDGLYEPDYHMFVSRKRFERYIASVSQKSMLMLPSFFGPSFVRSITDRDYTFFNIAESIDESADPIDGVTQFTNHLNVGIAAIVTAYQMGARSIFAAGMDGYGDPGNKEMVYFYNEEDTIDDKVTASLRYELLFKELERVSAYLERQSVPFFIITPTSHRKYFRAWTSDDYELGAVC